MHWGEAHHAFAHVDEALRDSDDEELIGGGSKVGGEVSQVT